MQILIRIKLILVKDQESLYDIIIKFNSTKR